MEHEPSRNGPSLLVERYAMLIHGANPWRYATGCIHYDKGYVTMKMSFSRWLHETSHAH